MKDMTSLYLILPLDEKALANSGADDGIEGASFLQGNDPNRRARGSAWRSIASRGDQLRLSCAGFLACGA
jgi:hypothetical protein